MADLEAAAAFFADSVQDLHFLYFDLVKRLNGGLDLDLIGVGSHFEDVLNSFLLLLLKVV